MEKFITAAGYALRISDTGSGPCTVVLLHGYLESLDVWDEFGKLLESSVRVVSLDLPGHGISQIASQIHTMSFLADTVVAVMDELSVPKCILVGHSMGGYVAMEFLSKYPDRLEGLVMLHSTPNADSEEKKEDRRREIAIVDSGRKELLSASAAKGFAQENRRRYFSFIESLKEQLYLTEEPGITALLRGMIERHDTNHVLDSTSVPVKFIFGCKDEHITVETAEKIASDHPSAQIVWLENSGHMGFVEEPEKTAAEILNMCPAQREEK